MSDFVVLLRKAVPEDELTPLRKLPKIIKSIKQDFSVEDYGHKKLLDLLKAFPEDIHIETIGDYTPPLYSCKLLPKDAQKKLIATPEDEVAPQPRVVARSKRFKGITSYPKAPSKAVANKPVSKVAVEGCTDDKSKVISLFSKFREQSAKTAFAVYFWDKAQGEDYTSIYRKVAEMAQDEVWETRNGEPYGILKNYLDQTFCRLRQENKIIYDEANQFACFNTGLQTDENKDIFMLFGRHQHADCEDMDYSEWVFIDIIDSYSTRLRIFGVVPEIATYIENAEDLVFNHKYTFETNIEHIIHDNRDRLLPEFQNNATMARYAIEGALSSLREGLKRNYALAVPHWHKGSLQLLLPLDMNGNGQPEMVLAIEKDERMKTYRVKTILSIEMAYSNARLLRKLDYHWLSL